MRKSVLISALAGIAADLSGCGKDADVLEYSFNRLEMAFFDECVFTEYFGSNGKGTLYFMVEGEKLWYYTNDDSYAFVVFTVAEEGAEREHSACFSRNEILYQGNLKRIEQQERH